MGNYRLYAREANGERNPDGSPCTGYVYRSLDFRSYADRRWLESRRYVPGRTWLYRRSVPAPLNFFEPKPVQQNPSRNGYQRNAIESHQIQHAYAHTPPVGWTRPYGDITRKRTPEPANENQAAAR